MTPVPSPTPGREGDKGYIGAKDLQPLENEATRPGDAMQSLEIPKSEHGGDQQQVAPHKRFYGSLIHPTKEVSGQARFKRDYLEKCASW